MKACVSSLTIFGPTEDLDDMQSTIQDGNEIISFEKILPTPQGIIDATANDVISPKIIEQFGAINVNAWRLKNWGCLKNAYNSKIIEEGSDLTIPEFVQNRLNGEHIPDEIREKMLKIRSALTLSFTTDESPNNAIGALSRKYPNILIHFGYDSEAEDECGWAALSNGEVIAHQHFSSCLKSIRINVEPSSPAEKSALFSFEDDDDSN